MGKPKDHYVPQFYLRNFANGKKQVRVFDRQEQLWRKNLTNTKDVSAEKDFYTIRGAGDHAREVETLLSRIEGEASRIVGRLGGGECVVDPIERSALSFYIAVQYLRTKSTRVTLDETVGAMDQMRAELTLRYSTEDQFWRQTGSMLGYEPTPEDVDVYKQSLNEIATGRISKNVTNLHMEALLRISLEVAPAYAQRHWTLLTSLPRSFITSDHPVCLFNFGADQSGLGLLSVDGVMFPLSPEVVLFIDLATSDSQPSLTKVELDGDQAIEVNELIASRCERQLYAHPRTKLPVRFNYPAKTKIAGEINGIPYRRGESLWGVLRKEMLPAWDGYFQRKRQAGSLPE